MARRLFIFWLLNALFAAGCPQQAQAHPIGVSGFRFLIYQNKAKAIFTLHTRDLSDWFPMAANANDANDICKKIIASPAELVDVRFDGKTVDATDKRAFVAEEGLIQVELTFPVKAIPGQIELWSKQLVHLPAGHQQVLFVEDMRARPAGLSGASVYEGTLSREDDHVTVDVPPPPTFVESSEMLPTTMAATSKTKALMKARVETAIPFYLRKAAVLAALATFVLILIAGRRPTRGEE